MKISRTQDIINQLRKQGKVKKLVIPQNIIDEMNTHLVMVRRNFLQKIDKVS